MIQFSDVFPTWSRKFSFTKFWKLKIATETMKSLKSRPNLPRKFYAIEFRSPYTNSIDSWEVIMEKWKKTANNKSSYAIFPASKQIFNLLTDYLLSIFDSTPVHGFYIWMLFYSADDSKKRIQINKITICKRKFHSFGNFLGFSWNYDDRQSSEERLMADLRFEAFHLKVKICRSFACWHWSWNRKNYVRKGIWGRFEEISSWKSEKNELNIFKGNMWQKKIDFEEEKWKFY